MPPRYLNVYHDNAVYTLKRYTQNFYQEARTLGDMNALCQHFRVQAISAFMISADPLRFFQPLSKSAPFFLQGLPQTAPETRTASQFLPLLDAIACRDFTTARALSTFPRTDINKDIEYEEDFFYFQYLMAAIQPSPDTAQLKHWLNAYQQLNPHEPRGLMISALFNQDAQLFDQALAAIIETHDALYTRYADVEYLPDELLRTEGKLFIEGLALCVLAEQQGIHSTTSFRYIPNLLRQPFDPASLTP